MLSILDKQADYTLCDVNKVAKTTFANAATTFTAAAQCLPHWFCSWNVSGKIGLGLVFVVSVESGDNMGIRWDVSAIKQEVLTTFVGRPMWAIIDLPNGMYGVYSHNDQSVGPVIEYNTRRQAAARLLQLMELGPVAPQTWPESICVGHAERAEDGP